MMFVVVSQKHHRVWLLERNSGIEEVLVEVAHGIEVVRAVHNMRELDGRTHAGGILNRHFVSDNLRWDFCQALCDRLLVNAVVVES